ncbi:MAG: septum formation inhibitor Maf [Clostridia bacterium]|nr:septum formation inhibitor Maf [Clostridia bacterium]
MRKIILASASPRRRELLTLADIKYSLCIKSVDETVPEGLTPEEGAEYTAEQKTLPVALANPDAIVIGADTIVVQGDEVFGKPADEEEARRMLYRLSGKEHKVITGVCLTAGDVRVKFHETSTVRFYKLDRDEINRYIKSGEPMDKAGAYGIQGKGALLVESIEGDFYNVVGLPIARLARELRKLQSELPEEKSE